MFFRAWYRSLIWIDIINSCLGKTTYFFLSFGKAPTIDFLATRHKPCNVARKETESAETARAHIPQSLGKTDTPVYVSNWFSDSLRNSEQINSIGKFWRNRKNVPCTRCEPITPNISPVYIAPVSIFLSLQSNLPSSPFTSISFRNSENTSLRSLGSWIRNESAIYSVAFGSIFELYKKVVNPVFNLLLVDIQFKQTTRRALADP